MSEYLCLVKMDNTALIRSHIALRLLIVLLLASCADTNTKRDNKAIPSCKCPGNIIGLDTEATVIYNFENERHLALWQRHSAVDTFPGHITYSNFILSDCETDSIQGDWGEQSSCTIEMSADTLVVKELSFMALSPQLDMLYMPWLIHKYYYTSNVLRHTVHFNAEEVHYTDKQIQKAFARMDTTKWRPYSAIKGTKDAERMMRFASQMMIATLSGNKEAHYYFSLVKTRFGPEDELALRYQEMEHIIHYVQADSTGTP